MLLMFSDVERWLWAKFSNFETFLEASVRNFWSTFACIFLGCLHKKCVVLDTDEAVCHALDEAVFSENVRDILDI